VQALLKQSQGGLAEILSALRFSEDAQIKAFLTKYDSLSKHDRPLLRWEGIALAAGVDPLHFLGAAMVALQNLSANTVKLMALSNHPSVMQKRIAFALEKDGVRDRDALQTGLGFLPTRKGTTLIINPLQGMRQHDDDEDEDEEDEDEVLKRIFPELVDTQQRLLPRKARVIEGE
jgi:hypothetical protein